MPFEDRYQPASFRGVRFFVDATSLVDGGRRVAVRRLAGKDGTRQQDQGGNSDEFDVEAFHAGPDYDLDRDDLEQALKKKGPGALVLPTRGELWVRVIRGPRTVEVRGLRGYCKTSFTVVVEDRQAGSLGIRTRTDTVGSVKMAASNLRLLEAQDFADVVDTRGLPVKYLSSTLAALHTGVDALRSITGLVDSTLNVVDEVTGMINDVDSSVNTLLSQPSNAATKLIAVVTSTLAIFDTVAANIDRTTGLPNLLQSQFERSNPVRSTLRAAEKLLGLGASTPEGGATTLARREAQNTRAVYRLLRSEALARQAETYARAPFESAQLALQVLETVGSEFDALASFSASDDMFQALQDLRGALAEHLIQTAANLPRTITYTPRQEIPAILIAWDLYADPRREQEIIDRNQSRHPLFVSGPLEVLES